MYFWRTYTKVKNGKHPSIASSLKKKEEFKNHTQKVWLTPCCAHLLTEKKKKNSNHQAFPSQDGDRCSFCTNF